jgi:hypothetical protein
MKPENLESLEDAEWLPPGRKKPTKGLLDRLSAEQKQKVLNSKEAEASGDQSLPKREDLPQVSFASHYS